ncbi:MAG: SIS domain-containing protein [Planctomycetota bacterium]|nr:SIS domain-containing protein [Planctomycetota bacterium]
MDEAPVERYLQGVRDVLAEVDRTAVARVVDLVWEAYRGGRRVFLLGNGGSAATASHMMCDLAKGCAVEGKPPVKAMSLTDNAALLTAVGNDIGYERLFTEQLKVFLEAGDVVLAISVSGNSPNVLDAVRYARARGAATVGLIGCGGGGLEDLVDAHVTVASQNYGHVEDVHVILSHLVSQCLRARIEAG